ncbi:hypothetical protein EGK74_02980 [Neisseria weixii]|uniref:Uncharacterized protein n=1 Tax=Neisseria weixii TaxID=1853276 RepID=A0A3N4N0I2_9NEIS|nr:hypothetical protein CGZ65_07900 [Neisseria weixii]RPD89762.1 hypothetical protein EGK74_02980 [Neisseria weixii]
MKQHKERYGKAVMQILGKAFGRRYYNHDRINLNLKKPGSVTYRTRLLIDCQRQILNLFKDWDNSYLLYVSDGLA